MAGETALARQLSKLAVPQTSLLIQDKIKKSFLFDHRDAAALDRDVFYSYGTTGLDKLKIINPLFEKFEQTLFSVLYMGFERSVQTASVNKKLDEKIVEFLRMLSPYFLIRPAHEALEWLVYRFHIHLYNADELVASVLPHYNTSTFVRVVQLLNLENSNNRWAWLKPLQKSGVHLEYGAIVNRFNSDGEFRKLVCNLAPNSFKVFKPCPSAATPIISFSMCTIHCALGRCEKVTDSTITFLFPYILKGLKSNNDKYIAASYLVISKIIEVVQLKDELVTEILIKVFENLMNSHEEMAFELLLIIFQKQPIKFLTKELFQVLLSTKGFLNGLAVLSENYDCSSLLAAIIKRSIPALLSLTLSHPAFKKTRKLFKFVDKMFQLVVLSDKTVLLCFNVVLNSFSKLQVKQNIDQTSLKETIKMLLKQIETKYPNCFDKAISQYFKEKNIENNMKLFKLINDSVCSVKNELVPSIQTTLVLGVNHANPEIRQFSTRYLLERAGSNHQVEMADADFVGSAMYERLFDDSADVVNAVLSYPKAFCQYVEKRKALLGFKHILNRKIKKSSNWYPVQMASLDIICDYFTDEDDLMFEIFVTILPFIFPLKKASIKGFVHILNSKLKDSLPVIQELEVPKLIQMDPESEMTDKQLAELNCSVFSSTRKYVEKLDDARRSSFVSYLIDNNENYNSFLTLYVYAVGHAIIFFEELDQKEVCVQHMFQFLKSFSYPKISIENATVIDDETLAQQCVESLNKQQFPGVVVYHTFYKIVKFVKLDYSATDAAPWELQNKSRLVSFNILTKLFEFCIKKFSGDKLILTDVFKSLFSALTDSQFQNPQHLFGFLSSLWSNALGNVPIDLQTSALTVADEFSKSSSLDWFFENYAFCISLLKAITSPEVEVRKSSLTLLSSLLQCSKTCSSPLRYLAEDVNGNFEEITVDHRQCFYLLNNWLAPVIDIYGQSDCKSILDSDISNDLHKKYSVLDNFIQLLTSNSTINSIKYFILLSLQETDSVGVLAAYIPIINYFLHQATENDKSLDKLSLEIIGLLLQKFSPKTASALQDNSIETETFFRCLEVVERDDTKCIEIQMSVLKVLSREFFTSIPSIPVQKKLLKTLLNIYMNSTSEMGGQLKKVLSKLCTFVYLIIKDFQENEKTTKKTTTLREVKKSKTTEGEINTIESKMWKQITVLLEIIQNKTKLDKRELLIPELFNLLNKTLNFDTQSSVEYVRQLILSSIYNCCQHLGREGLDERQFQVELIVQCIRSSTNPKTHHQSLLLLNLAATIFPDYVLNNVMSIFTFMGSSLIRQDDSYSIQVISQTIETIVPSLLAASNFQEENEAMQIVASVIRVFVDSLSDIPRHRQLPLFSKLITTLEPSKYLWVPLAQICDQYATAFHDMTSENLDDRKLSPTLEFAVNLHKQFSPSIQIDTCINLLQLLSKLPDNKEELGDATSFKEPFDVGNHTVQQLQIYKYNILSYINIWLSSQSFVSQVSELDSRAQLGLEEKYETLLEKALHYLQHQRDLRQDAANDRNRYSLFSLLYDLVGHINALLPCTLFIRVVHRLLQNPESVIKKKAIELLNCKLEQQQHLFTEENHDSLVKLLKPLLKVVQELEAEDSNRVENSALNQQTALYALHLLTKLIGSSYPKKFNKVLNLTVHILKDNQNQELTVNALLCLAQLCVSLNVKVLPYLNTFMPIIVDLLTDYKTLDLNDCLILGIITALQSLVENVGMFLSVYMQSLVTGVCMLSTKYLEDNKKTIQEKLLNFQTLLAKDVSLRVMLTALEDSYSAICSKDPNAVVPLMHILEKKLSFCDSTEVESSLSQLEKFYILLLSFRSSHSNSTTEIKSIILIETSIISALKSFVVKVSVTRFRLFFQRIYQWVVATEDSEEEKLKVYTFYSLTNELSKTLKSLFIVAAKYFLKHAASELDSNNSSKNEEFKSFYNTSMVAQLLSNILDTLNTCFVYDDGHLLDKDSFDCLLQPLVDQLDNLNSDETVYQERISNHLNSCIARFMAAVSDNTLWKKLNYQILLKTRHDSPVVRFAAIQTIREVVTVMGDNYLVLLPESIPFLAEVMEDESSEVEHECQSVIEEMEKILGEPIRKYF